MAAMRRRAWRCLIVALVLSAPGWAAADDNADAHALAEKFAQDSAAPAKLQPVKDDQDRQVFERKLEDEERLRADEQDMLARAREEAEARRVK